MPQEWYVAYPTDQIVGPLTTAELGELARAGGISPTDRVSTDRHSWVPATAVPGLAVLLVPAPASLLNTQVCDTGPAPAPPAGLRALAPGVTVAGYEILGELGAGAMGVVYRARQISLGREVALKTVQIDCFNPDKAAARFAQEAQTVARLRHPNIVTAYDYGRHGEQVFFTMELLEGESLDKRLLHAPRPGEAFTWGVIRQAAAGLAHAAARGVVHRDVKPGNLFLTPPPTGLPLPPGLPLVKVTDFGLALLHQGEAETNRLTASGMVVGTPMYMAPEQFAGSDADHRADLYALGVTAYEMLTGRPPFVGAIWDLLRQKTEGELSTAADISPASLALVQELTAGDPNRRLGSYEELLRRIDELLGPGTAAGGKTTALAPARRFRRTTIAGLGLAAVVGLGLGAHAWLTRPDAVDTAPPAARLGAEHALFDGQSMAGWTSLKSGWGPGQDETGAPVLAGRGLVRRLLPPLLGDYRLLLGANLLEAEAVELHFALHPGNPQPRYVLRVTRGGEAVAGRRPSDDGPFEPLTAAVPFPKAGELADRLPYLELQVERRGASWWAYFDGRLVGRLPEGPPDKLPEFRLAAEGGRAHFEGISVFELLPAP